MEGTWSVRYSTLKPNNVSKDKNKLSQEQDLLAAVKIASRT